jgi:hypothetical protein
MTARAKTIKFFAHMLRRPVLPLTAPRRYAASLRAAAGLQGRRLSFSFSSSPIPLPVVATECVLGAPMTFRVCVCVHGNPHKKAASIQPGACSSLARPRKAAVGARDRLAPRRKLASRSFEHSAVVSIHKGPPPKKALPLTPTRQRAQLTARPHSNAGRPSCRGLADAAACPIAYRCASPVAPRAARARCRAGEPLRMVRDRGCHGSGRVIGFR